jgi:uncharacterized protein
VSEVAADAALLRIFIGADDAFGDRPLAEAIIFAARQAGLAGATAVQGLSGFGLSAHIHEPGLLVSHDAPMIVEIIDTQVKIDAFLPELDKMLNSGLVTIAPVKVLRSGAKP